MRTKLVYALTSNGNDTYYEQLVLSLYSLRLTNPDIYCCVVCDIQTYQSLKGTRSGIFKYANDVIPVECPDVFSPMQRSRYLKTNLRQFVDGDFLYIDTDTIVCGDLSEIDSFQGDIGGVLDVNCPFILEKYSGGRFTDWARRLGWIHLIGKPFYNGGMMFVRDNDKTRSLFHSWYTNWMEEMKSGISFDQMPLCKAMVESDCEIFQLESKWNYQAKDIRDYSTPLILHYFASVSVNSNAYIVENPLILDEIKRTGEIPFFLRDALRHPDSIFKQKNIGITERQFDFLHSPIYAIYNDYPSFFKFLVFISSLYRSMITFLWNLKRKILK